MDVVLLDCFGTLVDYSPSRVEQGYQRSHQLVTTYLAEWNTGVTPITGVAEVLADLARDHRLAVVTNTHHPSLVPEHLDALGLSHHIDAVITSVEVGWRKPHPSIYRVALEAMQADPAASTFVGDTRIPDYDGPRAMGLHALLIDPARHHDVPEAHRLDSVLDLPDRLSRRG